MGCEPDGASALVCVPSAIPAEQRTRHFALARELLHEQVLEREELPNGYALRFAPANFESVVRFVANERKCCPLVSFEISVASGDGPLWLRMTGPAGTRAVLQAELNLPGTCGCQQDSHEPACAPNA